MRLAALILAAVLAWLLVPLTPAVAAKKGTITQWKCSGHIFCDDGQVCGFNDQVVGDKGGDVRRAVLRLMYWCADTRGLEPDQCARHNLTCREMQ